MKRLLDELASILKRRPKERVDAFWDAYDPNSDDADALSEGGDSQEPPAGKPDR